MSEKVERVLLEETGVEAWDAQGRLMLLFSPSRDGVEEVGGRWGVSKRGRAWATRWRRCFAVDLPKAGVGERGEAGGRGRGILRRAA